MSANGHDIWGSCSLGGKRFLLSTAVWAFLLGAPISDLMERYGYAFIHAGSVPLYLLAPAWPVLERTHSVFDPPIGALLAYYVAQYAYYFVLVGLWKKVASVKDRERPVRAATYFSQGISLFLAGLTPSFQNISDGTGD
jgi:hypothetical protein